MYNAVGGSTILYAAHWQRFMPSDFRVRTLDGVADDWPFTYEDLEPFYDQMDIEMGVSGLGRRSGLSARQGAAAAAAADRQDRHEGGRGHEQARLALVARAERNSLAALRRAQPVRAARHLPDRLSRSAPRPRPTTRIGPPRSNTAPQLITGARVREITVECRRDWPPAPSISTATGASGGNAREVVIVCANGVGTPRLLLLSRSTQFPERPRQLLRPRRQATLMMHPYAAVTGYFDEDLESWLGPAGQTIQSMQFYETDAARGFVRGAKWQVMPSGGPLGMRAAYGGKPLEEAWGANLHRTTRKVFGRSFEWGIIAEDLPERVEPGRARCHADRQRRHPGAEDHLQAIRRTPTLIDFHLDARQGGDAGRGALEMSVTPLMRDCGWHLMGTARMGVDPKTLGGGPMGSSA